MKKIILLIYSILMIFQLSKGQIDSIEYNIYEQIYDYIIMEGSYYFRDFKTKQIIESDSLIFNTDKYFSNFKNKSREPEYQDSVQFAIISRTLKNYNEDILYNKDIEFIRICRFRKENPIIILMLKQQNSFIINYKIGDGKFERKGHVIEEYSLKTNQKKGNKIKGLINRANLLAHSNNIECPDKELWMPNSFFVEFKNSNGYNIFVLTDCNLKTNANKYVFKLYGYLERLSQNKTQNK